MASLRTPEGTIEFNEHVKNRHKDEKCPLCEKESIKKFKYWRIVNNDFPYDMIAKIHHMIIPIRHVTFTVLSEAELKEIEEIKVSFINEDYDYIIEATQKNKSIPNHFHLHLIVAKF